MDLGPFLFPRNSGLEGLGLVTVLGGPEAVFLGSGGIKALISLGFSCVLETMACGV